MDFGLKESHIKALRDAFKVFPQITKVNLYGSRAKGNYKTGSDIDLAIYGDEISYEVLVALETVIDDLLLPYTVDLTIYSKLDNPDLVDHIDRIGIKFYQK